jgi:acyl carrier protein
VTGDAFILAMSSIEEVKTVLVDTLNLGERRHLLKAESQLLGSIPELDSMVVVQLIAALEQHFGFVMDDDEISAENFETVGNLAALVDRKLAG